MVVKSIIVTSSSVGVFLAFFSVWCYFEKLSIYFSIICTCPITIHVPRKLGLWGACSSSLLYQNAQCLRHAVNICCRNEWTIAIKMIKILSLAKIECGIIRKCRRYKKKNIYRYIDVWHNPHNSLKEIVLQWLWYPFLLVHDMHVITHYPCSWLSIELGAALKWESCYSRSLRHTSTLWGIFSLQI